MATDEQTEELEELRKGYRYETDEELERKRQVYRSHLVAGSVEEISEKLGDRDFTNQAISIVSSIIRARERARLRREMLREVVQWAGLLGPFVAGLFASPLVVDAFQTIVKQIG